MIPAHARIALLVVALVVALSGAPHSEAGPNTSSPLADAVLGASDAPVTVIEYSSLGCSHCAAFHARVLPDIRKRFIDTGQVRWIIRDFPLSRLPLAGAVTARCGGPAVYPRLIEVLFQTQDSWMRSRDPVGELEKMARTAGIDRDRFNACLDDEALIAAILEGATEAEKTQAINATPTFLVGGEKIVGYVPFATMRAVLERHLDGR